MSPSELDEEACRDTVLEASPNVEKTLGVAVITRMDSFTLIFLRNNRLKEEGKGKEDWKICELTDTIIMYTI
jgi:hypothetical protein